MAPHTEDSCHGDPVFTSDSVHHGQNFEQVTRLRYTKEELLSFKRVQDGNLTEKTGPSVLIEKQPSVAFKDERLNDVKPDQSQDVAEVEPQVDGTDNDLDAVVPEKKKKKKNSGKNKNKQAAPTGFEGKSLPPIILLGYANITL
jgi:hypothetical protein